MPQSLTVTTWVPVSPARAWGLFTDPHAVTQWNFASDDWQCPSASIDLTVGGVHRARMEARDGSFGFDFEGIYSEIEAPHALTLVLGDGRKARTTFTPSADGTRVETVFEAEDQNPAEMQQAGWQAILDNCRKHVETAAAD
jgi:uncharacterized protein YndB with AHSA1/START domain